MSVKKYTKKPVTIEAVQYLPRTIVENGIVGEEYEGGVGEILDFVCDGAYWSPEKKGIVIPTLEGNHLASPGDYIIKGVKGEFYPCKPDIFEMTYDKVPDVEWNGVAAALGRE